MTEHRPAGKWNFADLMAFDTIPCHGKCALAIVAASAGSPLLHLGHGDVRTGFVRFEQGIMAIRTGEHGEMLAMTECQRPEIGNNNRHSIDRMTTSTVFQLWCFGVLLVVARPA